jgi:hypothetical protein
MRVWSAGLPPFWPPTQSVGAALFERIRHHDGDIEVLIVKSYALKAIKHDGLGEDRRDG